MITNYQALCVIYYDLDKPFPPYEEYHFYLSYLEKYKDDILEPMCGSGRFLIPLLKAGYQIDAFDASIPMLNALKMQINKENLSLNYSCCLFNEFVFHKKYNLIYIPSASLSLLYQKNEFEKAIKIIYDNLQNTGSFVFEVETPEILEKSKLDFKLISNHFIAINENEKIIGSFINHSYINNILTISCRYDLIQNDIMTRTEFEDITIKLFTYEKIISILEKIGFTVICYKNFQKDIYNKKEKLPKLLILECIKK